MHASRIEKLLNSDRPFFRPKSSSRLERAYAMAYNARDRAQDRFEAMDFAHCCLDALDGIEQSTRLLVISGPLAQAKAKWDI